MSYFDVRFPNHWEVWEDIYEFKIHIAVKLSDGKHMKWTFHHSQRPTEIYTTVLTEVGAAEDELTKVREVAKVLMQ